MLLRSPSKKICCLHSNVTSNAISCQLVHVFVASPLDNKQLFTKGIKEFNSARSYDDYDRVKRIFDEVIEKAGAMSDASKYKGKCLLEMGHPKDA